MKNREKINWLLDEISKFTNTRNLFKGKFSIEEFQVEGLKNINGELIDSIELNINLVYTQLNLDKTEYQPTKKTEFLKKKFYITSKDNIEDFYNQFYSEVIQILALGKHQGGVSIFSYYINNGLENG